MKEPEFMKNWEKALESYQTRMDFADDSTFDIIPGDKIGLTVITSNGYPERDARMKELKEEAEKRRAGGISARWENDGCSCFLCDNLGQAKDIGNNLLLPYESYNYSAFLPNRFPAIRGHALIIEKSHRPILERPSISIEFLKDAFEISKKYNLAIMRNHPRSGMSIPGHDHFHSYFDQIESKDKKYTLSQIVNEELSETKYGRDIFSGKRSIFDSLIFKGEKSLEEIIKTIRSLEEKNIVFTIAFFPNADGINKSRFYITPHKDVNEKGVGAGYGLYFTINSPKDSLDYKFHIDRAKNELYLKNQFDWDKIFS